MSTLAEIEAAAVQLPAPEQEQLLAFLTEHLQLLELWKSDPARSIIGIIDDPEGPTDIARNDEDYLYGDGRSR